MLLQYMSIVIITTLSLIIVTFGISDNRFMPKYVRSSFQWLFILLIIPNWAEFFGVCLNGTAPKFYVMHFAAKMTEFIITPFLPVAAIALFENLKRIKWVLIPAVFNIFLQIFSVFNGCVFRITSDNIYVRGPLYLLYVTTFVIGSILLTYFCCKSSQKYQHSNTPFLAMVLALVILSIIFPFVIPNLRLDWVCTSFAAIIFYIYYTQLEQQTDSVTMLLNRQSYDYTVANIHNDAIIIFFDVDKFKTINDTHGHTFGDFCLSTVGTQLKCVFRKKGYCYRYGGDEFCVIMHGSIDDAATLTAEFCDKINDLKKTEPKIPSVSFGYAAFDSKHETIDKAIHRADNMMYRCKSDHEKAVK